MSELDEKRITEQDFCPDCWPKAKRLIDLIGKLRSELSESRAYANKLAASLADGCLPKDVETLHAANAELAAELERVKLDVIVSANEYNRATCSPEQFLVTENSALRQAGCKLAIAALRVAHEYDGVHRLMLAVSEWTQTLADEAGRGEAWGKARSDVSCTRLFADWRKVMICAICGGRVEWQGPLSNLTHTKCLSCGAINCQEVDLPQEDEADESDTANMKGDCR